MDTISLPEVYAGLVLLVTVAKFGFDSLLSKWIRKRQRQTMSAEAASKARGRRDDRANLLAFLALTTLSVAVLLHGFSSADPDPEAIERLQSQVDEIRSQLDGATPEQQEAGDE